MNTKQLRQKILDLAIRGKLVPQDPNDEPASVLLERVRAKKERLIKEGKIRHDKNERAITTSDKPRYGELPRGWVVGRLVDLAFYKKGPFGSSITKSMFVPDSDTAIKVYEQKNAISKNATLGSYFISPEKFEELKGFEVFAGDIIVSCAGTIGETYVMPENIRRGVINQALMRIMLYDKRILDWYLIYFDFVLKGTSQKDSKGTAIKNIPPFDILKNYYIPIPPLTEQVRIVEAVKNFNNIIDTIENNKCDILSAVNTTKLKILSLAISGKLVPQDPNDEPASMLLDRIYTEREQLSNSGKIKKSSAVPATRTADNSPYNNLPKSWVVTNLGEIAEIIRGITFPATAKTSEDTTNAVRCLTTGSVQTEYRALSDVFIDKKFIRNNNQWLQMKDIVMSSANSTELVGKSFVWSKKIEATFGGFLTVIRCDKNLNNDYVGLLLQYLWKKGVFVSNSTQTTNIANINNQILFATQIALPPLAEQKRIVDAIEKAFLQLDEISSVLN